MTTDRLTTLAANLPEGLTEIYFHPATTQDNRLNALMPTYEHAAELETLTSPAFRQALQQAQATLATYT